MAERDEYDEQAQQKEIKRLRFMNRCQEHEIGKRVKRIIDLEEMLEAALHDSADFANQAEKLREAAKREAELREEVEFYKTLYEEEKEVYALSVETENNLRREVERLSTALGRANADLMGSRDGALVRDLGAEVDRLKAKLNEWERLHGVNQSE